MNKDKSVCGRKRQSQRQLNFVSEQDREAVSKVIPSLVLPPW